MKKIVSVVLFAICTQSFSAAYKAPEYNWIDHATLEMGTLYGTIDSNQFMETHYADTFANNFLNGTSSATPNTLSLNPEWNFFVKLSTWLTDVYGRDISIRYRNMIVRDTSTTSGIVSDRVGVVTTAGGSAETLTNAADSANAKMRYQDIDLLSRNFSTYLPEMFKGLGKIRVYNGYGVKYFNLRKSFNNHIQGDSLNAAVGPVDDNVSVNSVLNAAGIKLAFGALWDLTRHWSLDGSLGVGVVAGQANFKYEETFQGSLVGNLHLNQYLTNTLYVAGLLDFEIALDAEWVSKNNEKAIISIGYQGEDLVPGTTRYNVRTSQSTNSFRTDNSLLLQAMKLSLKVIF